MTESEPHIYGKPRRSTRGPGEVKGRKGSLKIIVNNCGPTTKKIIVKIISKYQTNF